MRTEPRVRTHPVLSPPPPCMPYASSSPRHAVLEPFRTAYLDLHIHP